MSVSSYEMYLPARLNPGMAKIGDDSSLAAADIYFINENTYFHGISFSVFVLSKS